MRKIWVVVANSSLARIFHAVDVNTLVERQSLIHAQSHLNDRDLVSDGQGRTPQRFGYGFHPMEEKTPQRVKERHSFACQIVEHLEAGQKNSEFERIYLVASPEFLGELRQCFSTNIAKTVFSEISKDLTHLTPEELRKYLPPVL